MKVLGIAGNTLSGPFVSIHDKGNIVEIRLTHVVDTLRRTDILECNREELKLIGKAIFNSMEIRND